MPKVVKWILLCLVAIVAAMAVAAMRPGKPIEVVVSAEVEVPHTEAWQRMSDLSVAHNYVPGLTATEITTPYATGVGASRKVYQSGSNYLEETVTAWNEGEGFVIRLHKGEEPMSPFRQAEFRYHMEPLTDQATRVTLAIVVELPFGALGSVLGESVARAPMEQELTGVLAGLIYYYETGQPATDADRERLAGRVTVMPASG
ncbi:SRPBCC family protein [Parahaliea maris]|uniref:SRPBCC family protein n=1 Tax=Parahaliea maris TaxID=2716870 RepID=A0A5C9A4Y6_9GAMM|nr:SRPBCC family protein [Parahaliea maris]TXS94271.1 SRPBCC family protein [Parahaliea maris]